jgi:hypothetical protein
VAGGETVLVLAIAAFVALGFQQWLHARERQTLLDSIQAPEKVISERISPNQPMPTAVHPDSDHEYWLAKGLELADMNVEVPS